MPAGASSMAARRSPLLNDPSLRLPAIPITRILILQKFVLFDRRHSRSRSGGKDTGAVNATKRANEGNHHCRNFLIRRAPDSGAPLPDADGSRALSENRSPLHGTGPATCDRVLGP